MIEYLHKWVVVKRHPNRQNSYIGKIQCLFVVQETANQIIGAETDDPNAFCTYTYFKKEIVRIIKKEEKHNILQAQMHTRNNYSADIKGLQRAYRIALEEIAEGKRTNPFLFLES